MVLFKKNMVLLNKKKQTMIYAKYYFLRQICSNPKKVEIHDLQTDKDVLYPSIYKAGLALNQNTEVISVYDGKYGGTGMRSKS